MKVLKKIFDWCGSLQCWWVNFYLHGTLIALKFSGLHPKEFIWVNVLFFLLSIIYIWKKSPIS